MNPIPFTIVAAVNDRKVLKNNLLLSPPIADGSQPRVLLKEGFTSAALAYNSAIDEATTDTIVFVHQDIYLPDGWFDQVAQAIASLDSRGVRWGVLGCFGSRRGEVTGFGRVFTTGRGLHGQPLQAPEPVDTLDEIVLILRKSSGLRFDPALPHFHMYGTDVCLTARSMGMTNHAIPAFCIHNTNQLVTFPREFYDCYDYIKRKWHPYLPIQTSCMEITRFEAERRERQLKDFIKNALGRMKTPMRRVDDPRTVMAFDRHGGTR